MKFPLARLLFVLVWSGSAAAAPAFPPGPGALIPDAAHDPGWSELLTRLAPQRARQSSFTERRYFPFRTTPTVLTGEVRIDPSRGLSLAYLQPDVRTIIIDRQGVLLRDDRGRDRPMPADSRAQSATAALVKVLRFDLADWEKDFVLRGQRQGAAWQLTLAPRNSALASGFAAIVVAGEGEKLERIELVKSAAQRIEITLTGTSDTVIFAPAVLTRYFR